MRLIHNSSYKNFSELIIEFNKQKDSIYFKDYMQYTEKLLELTLKTVIECKRLGLSNNHILWLTKQIYENKLTENQVIEDYLPLVKFHFNNQDILKPIESYSTISEINSDIQLLDEENEIVSDKELDIFFEKDGWILSMPHTTKASCLLGKNTEWCTSRTKSQNLFLNYVGKFEDNIILFYVIRINGNPKKNPNDKLSVGFENGEPIFDGEDGGLTVNASNKGFKIKEFEEILGKELAKEMLAKMDEKSQSIKGKHPAKKEMERIAKSINKYLKKINKFKNEDELNQFKEEIAKYNLSQEIQILTSNDKNNLVRLYLARNPNLIESVQLKLADDTSINIRISLAYNQNLIESVQLKLAHDEDKYVKTSLARNTNLIELLQLKFVDDKDEDVRGNLAQNPNLFESVQLKLADDKNVPIRRYLAINPNLFESVQLKLADDKEKNVKGYLAQNPNLIESVQLKLADDKEEIVIASLAYNPNLIESVQLKLADDKNFLVKRYLAENPKLIESIQLKLADDKEFLVRRYLAQNQNLFESVQLKLAYDKDFLVRRCFALKFKSY